MTTFLFGNSWKSQEKGGRTFQIYRPSQNLRYSSIPISYLNYVVASLDCLVGKNLISWWISLSGREWREIAFSRTLDCPIFPLCLSPKWGESFNLKIILKEIYQSREWKGLCIIILFGMAGHNKDNVSILWVLVKAEIDKVDDKSGKHLILFIESVLCTTDQFQGRKSCQKEVRAVIKVKQKFWKILRTFYTFLTLTRPWFEQNKSNNQWF